MKRTYATSPDELFRTSRFSSKCNLVQRNEVTLTPVTIINNYVTVVDFRQIEHALRSC